MKYFLIIPALLFSSKGFSATFTVSTNATSGPGSLSAAIAGVNASPDSSNTVNFNTGIGSLTLYGGYNLSNNANFAYPGSDSQNIYTDSAFTISNGKTLSLSGNFNLDPPVVSSINAAYFQILSGNSSVASLSGSLIQFLFSGGSYGVFDANYAGGMTFNGGTLTISGGQPPTNLTLNNTIQLTATGNFVVQSNQDFQASLTIAGTINGGGGLNYTGPGPLSITGSSNTYGGDTTINNGTLTISYDAGLGGSSGKINFSGTNPVLAIANNATIGSARNMNISSGTNAGIFVGGTSSSFSSSGVISGSGSLTISGGTGTTFTLSGVNTYSGGTTLNGALLTNIGNAAAFGTGSVSVNSASTIACTGNYTISNNLILNANLTFDPTVSTNYNSIFSGIISGSYAISTINRSSGNSAITLSGANTYTGGTTINAGMTVIANNNNSLGTGLITFNGGVLSATGNINLSNSINIATNNTLISTSVNQQLTLSGAITGLQLAKNGQGALLLSNSSNTQGSNLIYQGIISITDTNVLGTGSVTFAGGTLEVNSSGPLALTNNLISNSGNSITIQADGTQIATLNGSITGTTPTNVPFVKSGSGSLNFDSSNALITKLSATGGVIQFTQNFATSTPPPITISGTNLQSLANITFGQTINYSGSLSLIANSSTTFTLNGAISGSGNITFPGPGIVTLGGSNTFTGAISITGGTVNANTNSIPTTSIVTLSGTGVLNAQSNLTIGGLISTATTPEVKIVGPNTLTIGGSSNCEYDGLITDGATAGGKLKVNFSKPSTVFTLTNPSNSYSGGTTITYGILKINAASLGTGTVTMAGGILEATTTCTLNNPFTFNTNSSLNVDSGQTLSLAGAFSYSSTGYPTLNGPGTLQMLNSSNSVYVVVLNNGTYAVNHTNDLPTGSDELSFGSFSGGVTPTLSVLNDVNGSCNLAFYSTGIVNVASGKTFTVSGTISQNSPWTKTGAGTLTLNTGSSLGFTGALNQSAGTINLGSGLSTQTINLNGGTFNVNSSGSFATGTTVSMTGASALTLNTSATISTLNMADNSVLNVSSAGATVSSLSATATTPIMNFGTVGGNFITIGGGVFRGKITGTGWFNIDAPGGTVSITNASNDFSQGLNIIDGTLKIPCASLGEQEITFYTGSGSPRLEAYGTTPFTLVNPIALSNTGIFIVDAGQSMTLSGQITTGISANLYKYYPGTLILNNTANNNSYAGINLNGGIVSAGWSSDLNGGVTFSSSSTLEIFQAVSSTGNITMNSSGSILTDYDANYTCSGTISGTNVLTKTGGGGRLILTGNNSSFTGGFNLNQGSIQVSSANALGSGVLTFTGGNLDLQGTSFTVTNSILLSEYLGSITTGSGNTYTLSGVISGNANVPLVIAGSGIVALSGANTYTGGTLIYRGGTLQFDTGTILGSGTITFSSSGSGANGTILIQDGANLTFSSLINLESSGIFQIGSSAQLLVNNVVSGAGGLLVNGSGTLMMPAGITNTYTGGTTIGGSATLSIGSVSNLGVSLATGITFTGTSPTLKLPAGGVNFSYPLLINSSNATVDLNSGPTILSGAIGSSTPSTANLIITATGGAANVTLSGMNTTGSVTLKTQGTNQVTLKASSANNLSTEPIIFQSTASTYSVLEATNSFSMVNNITLTSSGNILVDSGKNLTLSGKISGAGTLFASGTGSLILTNPLNDYIGGTTINSGASVVITAASLGSGQITMAGGLLESAATCTLTNPVTFNAANTINVDSGQTLSLAGVFYASNPYYPTLNGPGTLQMLNSGNTVYAVQLNNGTYAVTHNQDFPTGSNEISFGIFSGGVTPTLSVLENVTCSGQLAFYNPGIVNVASGKTFILSGTISNVSPWTKTGVGTLTLNTGSTLSFTGALNQSAGTINLGSGLSTTTVNLNGGTFNVNSGGSFATGTTVSMTGASVLNSNIASAISTLNMAGTSAYNVNANSTVGIFSSAAAGTKTAIASGQILTVNGAGNYAYAGQISGAGALSYIGSGVFTLSNSASSYSGGTTITNGTLKIAAASLGTGTITMNGGSLEAAATCTLNNLVQLSAGSSFNVDSGQTLSLNGQFTWGAGTLTLKGPGTLQMLSNSNIVHAIQFNNGTYAVNHSSDFPVFGNDISFGTISGGVTPTLSVLQDTTANCWLDFYSTGIINVANNKTLTIGSSAAIRQTAPWTKTGTGTLVASGSNSYSGTLTIQQGTVNFTSSPGPANINLAGGEGISNLIFTPSSPYFWSNQITGIGTVYKNGSSDLTIQNIQTYEGPLYVNEGNLILNGGSFPNVTITEIAAGAKITTLTPSTITQPDGPGDIYNDGFPIDFFCEETSIFSGAMVGPGAIEKTGPGSIEITGSWFDTQNILNMQGEFIANNSMFSAAVDNFAIWKGNNTVLSFVNESGGVQKPGNSIGTQIILGDYTANAGSTLEIEYDQFGRVDFVEVGGTATINSGANLTLIALPGYEYTRGEEYTFLTAGSAVIGTYSQVMIANEGDTLRHPVEVIYFPKSISFVLGIAPISVKDTYLIPFTSQLSTQIIAGQMDSLSTHLYMNLLTNIAAHPDDPCLSNQNPRVKGFAIYNHRGGGYANNGINFANQFFINSGLFGVQFSNENNFIGGFGGGYAHGKTIGSRDEGGVFSSTADLFAYFQSACIHKFIFDGFLMQNFSSYEIKRNSPTDLKAVGAFNGLQTGLQLRVLYESSMRFFNFIPYFAARYEYLSTTKYKERKAREDSNQISADHQNLLFTDLGFNICTPLYIKETKVMPQFGVSYIHQFFQNDRYVNIKNYDDTRWTQFKVNAIDRNMLKVNGGIEIVKKSSSYYVNADYFYGQSQYYTWDLRAGVKLSF